MKLLPNNKEQAFKELKAIDEKIASFYEGYEVKPQDQGFFHVILLKGAKESNFKVKINHSVQMYRKPGFEKVSKNFLSLNIDKVVLLHTPEKNTVEKVIEEKTGIETSEETKAEIERLAEEKAQAKFEALLKKQEAEKTKTVPEKTEETKTTTQQNVSYDYGKTVDEMKSFAEENGINISGLARKAEIESEIKNWVDKQATKQ